MPTIFLGENSHIQIIGKSPRSITGFWIGNGFNKNDGGAISSESQHLKINNILLSAHKSEKNGGALYSQDSVEMSNVHFKNNSADSSGGAIYTYGFLKMQNVIFDRNISKNEGGAIYVNGDVYAQNMIFSQNESNKEGGALFANSGNVKISNATFFDNNGKEGYSAIGGKITGSIYNSIFWKNKKSDCTLDKCQKEISPSLSIHHSIAETNYEGVGNIVGDPKFLDENKPGGDNDFMSMTFGLTLQDTSPAIGVGLKDEFVLETDILNIVRNENTDLGAYSWYDINSPIKMGRFSYGKFVEASPAYPVFESFQSITDIYVYGRSQYGRIMRKYSPKRGNKIYEKVILHLHILDKNGNEYSDITPIDVNFFYYGELDGKYIYQTLIKPTGMPDYNPEKHGRLILFSSDINNVGIYDDIQIIPIKNLSDTFYGEVEL